MYSTRLAIIALLTASLTLPACRDSSPVDTNAAETSAPALATASNDPVFNYRVHSDWAGFSASSHDEHSFRGISVYVIRAGPGPRATGYLSISGGECTYEPEWDCSSFWGSGPIPAGDVTGSFQTGGLAVHTDLRDNPGFWLDGTEPGIVSVRWERDGWYEFRQSGSRETRWGDFLVRENGTWRSASATATGEVLGLSLQDDWSGWMVMWPQVAA